MEKTQHRLLHSNSLRDIYSYLNNVGDCDEIVNSIQGQAEYFQAKEIIKKGNRFSLDGDERKRILFPHKARHFFESGEHDSLGPKSLPRPKPKSDKKQACTYAGGANPFPDMRQVMPPTPLSSLLNFAFGGFVDLIGSEVQAAIATCYQAEIRPSSKFESAEHDQTEQVNSSQLKLPNGDELTFGQIIALGGDFFGIPYKPICGSGDSLFDCNTRDRFMEAYATLAHDDTEQHKKEVKQLLAIMAIEKNSILTVLGKGDSNIPTVLDPDKTYSNPSEMYEEYGMWFTQQYDTVLGGTWIDGYPIVFGRMMELAVDNPDHFHPYAPKVYRVGHEIAIEKAESGGALYKAGESERNKTKMKDALAILDEAYAVDAFACHFLTDSFASGHMRVPRNELPASTAIKNVGNYLVHFQHDEDGKFGINVCNNNSEKWTAFGDGRLFDPCSKKNLELVRHAVEISIESVWDAFCNPTYVNNKSTFAVDNTIPYVDNKRPNNYPLFSTKNGAVLRRNDVNDLSDSKTKGDWWGITTVALLKGYNPKNSRVNQN